MRAIDVCAGAGGFSLGLQGAGWSVVGVENDADAVDTHRRHVGPCDLADTTTWHPEGTAELVVGGVPCQSFSVAGERKGLEDDRGQLYRHLVRIASEAEARCVIMENVEGLLSTPGALGAIYSEMRRVGYTDVEHRVLCAADYGTPQKRYRLFIVGIRDGGWRWPAPTHAEGPILFGLRPWVTVREALGLSRSHRLNGHDAGANGWNGQRMLDVEKPASTVTGGANPELLDQPSYTITSSHDIAKAKVRAVFNEELSCAGGSCPAPSVLDRPALTLGAGHDTYPDGEASRMLHEAVGFADAIGLLDKPSSTISAGGTESGGGAEPLANRVYREELARQLVVAGLIDRPATTIAGDARLWEAGHHANAEDCCNGEQPSRNQNAVRLTVDQCALLQGFPPGWTWTGTKASQHRQVGNAVPPQLGEALGRSARGDR